MMLKIVMSHIDVLKTTLASIATIRKDAVFRFTREKMNIVSAHRMNEPQIWCELSLDIFDEIEVESKRDNTISFELNIVEFLNILKSYESVNSDQIVMKLQRLDANDPKLRKLSKVAVHYKELNDSSIEVSHSSSVIIRLLNQAKDEAIREPGLDHVNIVGHLPSDISAFFKRMERFKDPMFFEFSLSNKGLLTAGIESDTKNVLIQWNGKVQVQTIDGVQNDNQEKDEEINYVVMIKEKDLQLKSRFFEVVKESKMFIAENEALVFDCMLDDSRQNRVLYFIKGTVRV